MGKGTLDLRIIRLEDAPQIRLFVTKRFTSVGNDESGGTLELRETYGRTAEATCKAPRTAALLKLGHPAPVQSNEDLED